MPKRSPRPAATAAPGPPPPAVRRRAVALSGALLRSGGLATLAALALAACAGQIRSVPLAHGTPERPPATTAPALHRLVDDGAPGAASLITRDGFAAARYSTAGVADLRTGRRMAPQDHFRAGSLTKTLVATVVLQLAAEGRLTLPDHAAAHLPPGVPATGDGDRSELRRVTIRQLLAHTSGLFNYTQDPRLSKQLYGTGFGAHRYDSHTPAELLRIALSHPPWPHRARGTPTPTPTTSCSAWSSRRSPAHPYATEIRRRILVSARLDRHLLPRHPTPVLPAPHGRAYSRAGARRVRRHRPWTPAGPARRARWSPPSPTSTASSRRCSADGCCRRASCAQMRNDTAHRRRVRMGLYPTKLPCGVTVWGHNGDINGSLRPHRGHRRRPPHPQLPRQHRRPARPGARHRRC